MTTLTYSARLALFLTTMIILERAASRVQGKASPNAATPDSNSSLTAVSGSKTTRGLPDKFIQSLNHLQQQLQGGIDHHDQDDMSENSAMYWLRIEMIKVKILAKLQMDKVPVIKEKQKESKIKELLASLNLTGEDDVDEKKEEEERNYFGRTTKIIVFSEKGKPTKNERGDKTPLTLLQAPRYSRYFVSKDQPVKLTWEATDVCKIQITCNGDKFNEGDGRAVRETCQGWKTKKKTRTIKFSDFPRGSRTMNCQAKFWGINSTKTEKITLTKVFLFRNFGKVKSHHVVYANTTVILLCKPPMGYPPPNITWYKNGEPLFFCCGRSLRDSAKTLVIKGVSKNDSGDYQCVALNMAARRQGPMITLKVRGVTVEVRKKNVSASDCNKSKVKCYGEAADGYKNGSNKSASWASYSPMLIVGKEDEIVTYELQNNSWTRRSLFPAKDVAGLECAHDKRHIYWSDRKEINELSLATTLREISPFHLDRLNPAASPNSLAFNWIDYQLYWIDAKDIYLGDLRNWRIVRLIEGKLDIPKAIALSPSDGFIYWAVWGQVPKIMRARLDGTERKELINEGITFPQALALDESNRRLFWAGTDETKSQGIIEWVSLDGLNRNVTFRSPGYCPYSLDIYEGFVYWADRRKKAILRISSRGGEEEMVITGLKKPVGVKFCQERTEFENNHGSPCDQNNGGCDYLCVNLHFSKGPRCMYQKDMNLKGDGKTCEKAGKNEIIVVVIIVVIIIVVVLLLALLPAVYIIVKKHFSHFTQVDKNVREDIGEEPTTERTCFLQENLPPSFDASEVLSQQYNAEPSGAGDAGEDSSVRLQRGEYRVRYDNRVTTVHLTTVNMSTQLNTAVKTNVNTTNNYKVELEQTGGMTVVGDNANINNYHQPPQN